MPVRIELELKRGNQRENIWQDEVWLESPETITEMEINSSKIVELKQDFPALKILRTWGYTKLTNIEHLLRPDMKIDINVHSEDWYIHPAGAPGTYKIYAQFCDLTRKTIGQVLVVKAKYARYNKNSACSVLNAAKTIQHVIYPDSDEVFELTDMTDVERGSQGWRKKAKRRYCSRSDFEADYGDLWEYLGTIDPDRRSRAKSAYSAQINESI